MASQQKLRILVVDDDPSVLQLVSALLERSEIEPLTAQNASQAAAILRQQPLPDLVILDLMLPEISGIDFLKQIRAKSIFDDLPVLILSALADP